MNATGPTPELDELIAVARGLPPHLVRELVEFAESLRKDRGNPAADESDAWTEDDLRDLTRHANSRLDKLDPAEPHAP